MTDTTGGATALRLWDPSLSVGDEEFDIGDLVLLGLLEGSWQEFAQGVRGSVALEREYPEAVGDEEVRAAATAFRYRHRLVSAAEFRTWLDERHLTVADLSGVLRRSLLWERLGERDDVIPASDAEIAPVLNAEALASGVLAKLAEQAVACMLAVEMSEAFTEVAQDAGPLLDAIERDKVLGLESVGEESLRLRIGRLRRGLAALRHLQETLQRDGTLQKRLADHGLDWVRLRGEELSFATEHAAREARLLATEDGLAVAAVAERAGAAARPWSLLLEYAPEAMAAAFSAAAPGDVLGPWEEGERWQVLWLRERVPPSLEDPELRARAAEEGLEELINRRGAGRVRYHVGL